jgi:hypothetical protein
MTATRRKPSEVVTPLYRDEAGYVAEAEPPEPTRAELYTAQVRSGAAVLDKPRTEWLIRGYIPARSWGVGYGPPGGGKSFHTLTLALEAARGGRWAGQELDPMKVLYIAAERVAVLGDRQEAWTLHHRETIPDTFHELAWNPQLHQAEDVDTLCEVVRGIAPRLVLIDTLAQCTLGLEENATREMGLVIDALNRITAATDRGTVHVVHHTGKDPTKGMRGSSALLGAADYTMEIGGDPTAIRVTVPKLNASVKPMPEWYRLEGVNMPPLPGEVEVRSGAVMVPTTGKDAGTTRIVELLPLMAESYRDTGITRREVEELLDVSRPVAGRALQTAVERGRLTIAGRGPGTRYYLTPEALEELGDHP